MDCRSMPLPARRMEIIALSFSELKLKRNLWVVLRECRCKIEFGVEEKRHEQ
jgi:hypothetical protein